MHSPVPHLQHSNLAPSLEDVQKIRNVLAQAEPELLALNAQVSRAKEVLQQLLRQRDETQSFVETHRGFLSIIRRLPREIIGEIFLHTLPKRAYIRPDIKDAPLLLTQICTEWRDIALTSPMIWSSIEIITTKALPPESLITTWLQRSGSAPLSISLISTNPSIGWPLLPLFTAYIHRWRSVNFAFHHGESSRQWLLDIPSGGATLLEHANIHFPFLYSDAIRGKSWWVDVLHSAPRLQSVTWSGPDRDLPWFQLTHLNLSNLLTITRALQILLEAPNLIECYFGNLGYLMPPEASDNVPFLHEQLQQLEIAASSHGANLGAFLERLTLPALTDIVIRGQYPRTLGFSSWRHDQLLSLFTRSSCSIRSLSIPNSGMTDVKLLECLSHTSVNSSLTRLVISDSSPTNIMSDMVIKSLTHHILDSCLNPNLETIHLRGCLADTSDGLLADMVESRWQSRHPPLIPTLPDSSKVATLRGVLVELPSVQVQDIKRLEKLRDEGLDIEVAVAYVHAVN